MRGGAKTIGVISDTHGLVRPEAIAALRGCDAIVHAGDIGKPEVLEQLARLAPLTAIRGNVDMWAADLPDTAVLALAGKRFYVIHNVKGLELDPRSTGFAAVISGHSHVPKSEMRDGVLYLNPGSAGPRRFRLPVGVAKIRVHKDGVEAELVTLSV
jgi:putative phosphoesterase